MASSSKICAALLGLGFVLGIASPATAAMLDAKIESFSLANGMQVVLLPNHRVPAVTHMLFYKIGAADDYPGRSGLAHYNEHMMFQGTEKIASGEFAKQVARHGGHTNALTSHDYTAYYVSINKAALPMIMELEADRMVHLAPSAENFAKEREVIIEERRMTVDNKPASLLDEEMRASLFLNHPYHNSVIGWAHEMAQLSREDVLQFHQDFYHPANATLVVTGDISREELQPLAERYYGSLPSGKHYERHWRSEPPHHAERHLVMHHENVKEPGFARYYLAPSVNTAERNLAVPAFVLSQILGSSTGALYQSLVVKQKIATTITASYEGLTAGPGVFSLYAVPAEGVSLPTLEDAINKELKQFTVSPDDLARAKTQLKADTIYARDGLEGMAQTLGALIMAGLPPEYFNQWPKLIERVSAESLQNAAQAIFIPNQSVTGYLMPKGAAQ